MKRLLFLPLLFTFIAAPLWAAEVNTLENDQDKISYAVGMNIGKTVEALDFNIDLDILIAGLTAAFNSEEGLLSESEMGTVLNSLQQQLQQRAMAEQAEIAEENLEKGNEFLKQNAKEEGVKSLESGLQYKIITKAAGAIPTKDDTVRVHYRGTLIDGTEFDSSYQTGNPVEFPVGGVIPGWVEILQLMHVGEKLKVAIPPSLAYGEMGAPPRIEPNTVLLFELELLEIVEK
ncbi:MAG TPA: FKBP-type peptidyl-prolyl cis-trans isomerase [Geopsychrobacteraceae bacterium]|nr:FKBP-type peptidyl-prolyl cis-trans isomerase [Geopsychrobacteraceae bacterium]